MSTCAHFLPDPPEVQNPELRQFVDYVMPVAGPVDNWVPQEAGGGRGGGGNTAIYSSKTYK